MFKNMKIEITDELHLKAVCEVLESMGYHGVRANLNSVLITSEFGKFSAVPYCTSELYSLTTLTDLLKMRDEKIKGYING